MRKPMLNHCIVLASSMLLGACMSMAPAYKRPAAPVPETWPTGPAYAPLQSGTATAAELPWEEFVKDEKLRAVIAQALANSRDLRGTLANIAAARAQYRSERAGLFPKIQAEVSHSRSRSVNPYAGTGTTTEVSQSDSVSVGVSSFELDLFGKQRSLSNAAFETYLATAEAGRAARITLIAETTQAYLTLAADRSQFTLSQRTVESAQRSMELTRKRLDAGVASGVDVRQAETIYQQARADLASLKASIAQDRNALDLLAGSPVDESLLPTALPSQNEWLSDVPAGIASEVLLNRPDVLQAEHNLKSANANIGAARASFFPSLTLTGSGGRSSSSLSTLFSGPNVWSIATSAAVPIFSGGENVANLQYSKAQRDLYLSEYELAVQTAFREVADALAERGTIQERLDAQSALVEAASASYRLAEARYSKGVDTFLNALDSQRTLYSAEQTLVSTRLTAIGNIVTVYRVLGGGGLTETR